jgi:hypothetical protein
MNTAPMFAMLIMLWIVSCKTSGPAASTIEAGSGPTAAATTTAINSPGLNRPVIAAPSSNPSALSPQMAGRAAVFTNDSSEDCQKARKGVIQVCEWMTTTLAPHHRDFKGPVTEADWERCYSAAIRAAGFQGVWFEKCFR